MGFCWAVSSKPCNNTNTLQDVTILRGRFQKHQNGNIYINLNNPTTSTCYKPYKLNYHDSNIVSTTFKTQRPMPDILNAQQHHQFGPTSSKFDVLSTVPSSTAPIYVNPLLCMQSTWRTYPQTHEGRNAIPLGVGAFHLLSKRHPTAHPLVHACLHWHCDSDWASNILSRCFTAGLLVHRQHPRLSHQLRL